MKSEPVEVIVPIDPLGPGRQEPGDDRRVDGAGGVRAGTSGVLGGLSGAERQALVIAWGFGAAIGGSVCAFNVLTRLHDTPEWGLMRPVLLEGSSLLVTICVFAIPAAIAVWLKRRRPGRRWAAAVLVAGWVGYAVLHIAGFYLLRSAAFPLLLHAAFDPGPPLREIPYEAAKDLLAYSLSATAFWLMLRWAPSRLEAAPTASEPSVFDIRDGGRLVRARLSDILAVRSAGNYVEFLLEDGRRPLMRSPLNAVAGQLAAGGFVRTHRSWLVNRARVTGLRPEGSGDYAVELGALTAPLSRRFPDALSRLRGEAP